jgi:hypothetical protein
MNTPKESEATSFYVAVISLVLSVGAGFSDTPEDKQRRQKMFTLSLSGTWDYISKVTKVFQDIVAQCAGVLECTTRSTLQYQRKGEINSHAVGWINVIDGCYEMSRNAFSYLHGASSCHAHQLWLQAKNLWDGLDEKTKNPHQLKELAEWAHEPFCGSVECAHCLGSPDLGAIRDDPHPVSVELTALRGD